MVKLTLLILLLAVAAGCNRQAVTEDKNNGSGNSAAPVFSDVLVQAMSEYNEERISVAKQVATALSNRDYEGLDKMAQELRTNQVLFASGYVRVKLFYEGLIRVSDENPDEAWDASVERINLWIKNRPESITARLALADLWLNYAYKARGTGYADSVTKQGWELFEKRTAKARAILEDAGKMKEKCPMYWVFMQHLALNEGWPQVDYDKLFTEAVRSYPGVNDYYYEKGYYIQPRWYGKEGDWEAFAAESADKIGGDEGDILYARIMWNMKQMRIHQNIYAETKISWERAKRGFWLLHKRYPDSLALKSEFCFEAGLTEDKEPMQKMFRELGNRYVKTIWISEERFKGFREWAFAN